MMVWKFVVSYLRMLKSWPNDQSEYKTFPTVQINFLTKKRPDIFISVAKINKTNLLKIAQFVGINLVEAVEKYD